MTIPAEGWGENRGSGGRPARVTWTVWGPSWNVEPPVKEGYHAHFIARHGVEYTTWIYRPNTDACGCSESFKNRGQKAPESAQTPETGISSEER